MKTERIPLAGSITNRGANPANFSGKGQTFINCYPEVTVNPLTGKRTIQLNKRPGYAQGGALTGVTSAGLAMVLWAGNTTSLPPIAAGFINTGATSTSVWNLQTDAKLGGDIASTSQVACLTETTISGVANLVGNFVDSSTSATEQWFFPEGGAWTQVTDGDFPTNIVGCPAHMDGYTFNMTLDGKVYNSDLNSVSAYTAGNFITAGSYPDKGVTVARLGEYIMAFGESSIEPMVNAGNAAGSPLSRVTNGTIRMGTVRYSNTSNPTVLPAFGTIFFNATMNDSSAAGIYRFNGLKPEKISTPAIDKLLMSQRLRGFAGTLLLHGMRHVVMTGDEGTFAFCLDTGVWWNMTLASGAITVCVGLDQVANGSALTYFTGTNNARGNFFSNATTNNQDSGSNFTMTVQTDPIDFGTRKMKMWKGFSLIGDVQSAASNVAISYSDDDYATFSTARNIDMNTQANRLTGWGASRKRAWKLTNSANTTLRLEAIEFDFEVGPH